MNNLFCLDSRGAGLGLAVSGFGVSRLTRPRLLDGGAIHLRRVLLLQTPWKSAPRSNRLQMSPSK